MLHSRQINSGIYKAFMPILVLTLGLLSGCTTPKLETEAYVDGYKDFNAVVRILLNDYEAALLAVKGAPAAKSAAGWPPVALQLKAAAAVGTAADVKKFRDAAQGLEAYNELLLKLARGEDITKLDRLTSTIQPLITSLVSRAVPVPFASAIFDQLRAAKSYADFNRALRYAAEPTRLADSNNPKSGLVLCASGDNGCIALIPTVIETLASAAREFDRAQAVLIDKMLNDTSKAQRKSFGEAIRMLTNSSRPTSPTGGKAWDLLRQETTAVAVLFLGRSTAATTIAPFGTGGGAHIDVAKANLLVSLLAVVRDRAQERVDKFYDYRAGLQSYVKLAGTTLVHLQRVRAALNRPPDVLGAVRGVLPNGLKLSEESNAVFKVLLSSR